MREVFARLMIALAFAGAVSACGTTGPAPTVPEGAQPAAETD